MANLMLLGGLLVVVSAMLAALGFRGREQIVGIDLGTTFSVVALRKQGVVTVVPDRFSGSSLIPSVVSFLGNNTVVVGDRAVALRSERPLHTIFNAKRFIGRSLDEVTADAALHPYRVIGNMTDDAADAAKKTAGFGIPRDGLPDQWVSPIDVGAEVVRYMKQNVAFFMGYPISRAVICVPAKFSHRETKATVEAFEQAGFKVDRVLEEPSAAAVAYNLHKQQGMRHVLVYDIGGGTLDTSLLYTNGKAVSVLGVAGDDHLGGSDFDHRLCQVLEAKLASARQLPTLPTAASAALLPCHRNGLHVLAEQAKISLSADPSVEVQCLGDDGFARGMTVSRSEFEEASSDLFERALAPVRQVLEDQVMTPDDVHDVVLVGGTSRMPQVRQLLRDFFGEEKQLHTDIDPDITVAYGAANIVD